MNLNLMAPYNSLGYGIASKNILRCLSKEHTVSYFNLGEISLEYEEEKKLLYDVINNRNFYDSKAPTVKIWHQNLLAETVGRGLKVGFPFFELNKFTDIELHHLNSQDIILVTSEWARNICKENKVETPVYVVPLGVDTNIFSPKIPNIEKTYKFINIGKWEIRKGHPELIDAFNKAFESNDAVELILCCSNPFLSDIHTQEWINLAKNSKLGDKISIINRVSNQKQLYQIMKQCDAGCFPSKAEGWNLDLLECLAMGLPVIATNYSGHTEFCNKDNALLVECPNLESAYDGIWFHGQGEWAELGNDQIEQMVEHMRYLYKNDIRSNHNGILTGKQFTWENAAKKLVTTLE